MASCGGGSPGSAPTTTTSRAAPGGSTTASAPGAVTVRAAVSPDQGATGTVLTFTVEISGPGTLRAEHVTFGDGVTSGSSAGNVACGDSARADHTSTYTHAYAHPGSYRFRDQVMVQAPPPACGLEHVTAHLTVIAAVPLSDAALNGAFVSPTKNIACYLDEAPPGSLRCATFTPPQLVTMDTTGTYQTCTGNQCNLGNPAMETPVLPYGTATAGGAFQCLSAEQGMICTVVGHKGFELSRSGVVPVG